MPLRRSWAKANSPYWSSQVACWLSSNLSAQEFCRQRDLSITTFELWMHHLVSSGDLRKRAEKLQNLRRKKTGRQRKTQPKHPKSARAIVTASARTAARLLCGRSGACPCRGAELERHGPR
ncbi:hypothetical protein RFM68_15410 [Mesorhizobium sp. MSK_1335]|uniref:Helix-turn-helix domain-containing protein n=1 Tax=Mesorhizobium montanum TaxID=3072323 RepID=A0ABU4ZKK9_9HYPH|nr:hypothetical protein [Mesorhizobium sp. MSK_1335]MDX8525900.1 hypothetical protein [Mesorhizobium sp. MSK_1335]